MAPRSPRVTARPSRTRWRRKEAVKSEDVESLKEKTNALAQASMKLGEAMYAAQQDEAGAEGAEPKKDDVVDADFTEVKDDKKKSA